LIGFLKRQISVLCQILIITALKNKIDSFFQGTIKNFIIFQQTDDQSLVSLEALLQLAVFLVIDKKMNVYIWPFNEGVKTVVASLWSFVM